MELETAVHWLVFVIITVSQDRITRVGGCMEDSQMGGDCVTVAKGAGVT